MSQAVRTFRRLSELLDVSLVGLAEDSILVWRPASGPSGTWEVTELGAAANHTHLSSEITDASDGTGAGADAGKVAKFFTNGKLRCSYALAVGIDGFVVEIGPVELSQDMLLHIADEGAERTIATREWSTTNFAAASHTHAGFAAANHTHLSSEITDASNGGNGPADSGKLAKFNADGNLTAATFTATTVSAQTQVYSPNFIITGGISFGTIKVDPMVPLTGDRVLYFPDRTGTIATVEGTLSDAAEGNNGPADAGKLAKFSVGGGLGASEFRGNLTVGVAITTNGVVTFYRAEHGQSAQLLGNPDQVDDIEILLPADSGTLARVEDIAALNLSTAYQILRAASLGTVRYPEFFWTTTTISGTITSGTESTNLFPFVSVASATAGKGRQYHNLSSGGPVWPGKAGQADFARKAVARFSGMLRVANHSSSKIAMHFTHDAVTTHSSFDRSTKGFSVIIEGGATPTAYIQAHNGTGVTNSTAGTFASSDDLQHLSLEWEPGVAARLYRNGNLVATLTTGLPTGLASSTSSAGMVIIVENTVSGTGQTLMRNCGVEVTEVP